MTTRSQRLRFVVGEQLSARKMNLLAGQAFPGRGTTGGRSTGTEAEVLFQVEIKSINHVTRELTCTQPGMTATGGAEEWVVELPSIFTETSRATTPAQTFTYSATDINARDANDGTTTESQEITPGFVLNELIMIAGFSEETVFRFVADGRMWAKV